MARRQTARQLVVNQGDKFGRLTVLGEVRENGRVYVRCQCICGNTRKVLRFALFQKESPLISCGCYREERKVTHGECGITPEHAIWRVMLSRCTNPNDNAYARYGERGISVCQRWKKYENFLKDMGRRPSSQHSIDRINNNGNYEPGNCRWATKKEQARNRRVTFWLTINGETRSLAEWVERAGLNYNTVYSRLHKQGLTPKQALEMN
jgi:hypothetical protein